jgi:hypothetical protein
MSARLIQSKMSIISVKNTKSTPFHRELATPSLFGDSFPFSGISISEIASATTFKATYTSSSIVINTDGSREMRQVHKTAVGGAGKKTTCDVKEKSMKVDSQGKVVSTSGTKGAKPANGGGKPAGRAMLRDAAR